MSYEENKNLNSETNPNSEKEVENFNASKILLIFLGVIAAMFVIAISIAICTKTCIISHDYADATCVSPQTCVRCGETKGQPLGHKWIDATCETAKTCETCGETEGQPLGHTLTNEKIDKQATCTESGIKSGHCSVCGKDVTETIPATGHTLGQWEIGTQATLDSSGEKIQKCTQCGEIINKDIYYLTDEEKAEIVEQQRQAKIAAAKAEKEAKEKAEKEKEKSMYEITILSAERYTSDYVRIKYRIKNNSSSDKSRLELRGTLYDSNGNGIASSNSYVRDLPANQSKEEDVHIKYSGNDWTSYNLEIA